MPQSHDASRHVLAASGFALQMLGEALSWDAGECTSWSHCSPRAGLALICVFSIISKSDSLCKQPGILSGETQVGFFLAFNEGIKYSRASLSAPSSDPGTDPRSSTTALAAPRDPVDFGSTSPPVPPSGVAPGSHRGSGWIPFQGPSFSPMAPYRFQVPIPKQPPAGRCTRRKVEDVCVTQGAVGLE